MPSTGAPDTSLSAPITARRQRTPGPMAACACTPSRGHHRCGAHANGSSGSCGRPDCTAAGVRPAARDYLRTLQPTVELALGDDVSLLCYHGSPRSNREEIRVALPDAELAERLGSYRPLLMAGGHVHEQFLRRLDQTIVLNPGSVGLPWETEPGGKGRNPPWAEYAVVRQERGQPDVEFRRVAIDQAAVRQALLDSGMPHAAWWAADWR
jgi:predicted phosphodiesterase